MSTNRNDMCPHCSGTGIKPSALPETNAQAAPARPLPPGGLEVERQIALGWTGEFCIYLFCDIDDPLDSALEQVEEWEVILGDGHVMTLEPGKSVADYRWPKVPLESSDRLKIVLSSSNLVWGQMCGIAEMLRDVGFACIEVEETGSNGEVIRRARYKAAQDNGLPSRIIASPGAMA